MKYMIKFSDVASANTAGAAGMISPHLDWIEDKNVANIIMTDSSTFTCSYSSAENAESVTPVVPLTPETWYFKSEPCPSIKTFNVNFTSNNTSYTLLKTMQSGSTIYIYYDSYNPYCLYGSMDKGIWTDQAYRTIVLDSPATGDLLTFLQANATKQ